MGQIKEEVVKFKEDFSKTEPYVYFFEEDKGSRERYSEEDICGEDAKQDALNVKERYQKELDKIGISEEDLLEFDKWINENTKRDVLKKAVKAFNEQEKLTIDEIVDVLKAEDFYMDKLDDESTVLSYTDAADVVYFLIGNKNRILAYEFKEDDTDEVFWLLEGDDDFLTQNGRERVYDLNKEEHVTTKKLTDSQITDGKYLKISMQLNVLNNPRLTREDLFTFFAEYKK